MTEQTRSEKVVSIRHLRSEDVSEIVNAYQAIGWPNSAARYERYLKNQAAGTQTVLVARVDEKLAGYLTVKWESLYESFRVAGIPEINDFSVLPEKRRQRTGSKLMDAAEGMIKERSSIAGIGVGMTADYGPAQRMYVLRGYLPDTRGLMSHNQPVQYGESVLVDDDLVLYFTKNLQ